MAYCAIGLRVRGSIYINHFEAPISLNHVRGVLQKACQVIPYSRYLITGKARKDPASFIQFFVGYLEP
jgi:hypothetical protein